MATLLSRGKQRPLYPSNSMHILLMTRDHGNNLVISKHPFSTRKINCQCAPDSKVHGTIMGPIWGRQDPGGPMLAPWTLLSGVFCCHGIWMACDPTTMNLIALLSSILLIRLQLIITRESIMVVIGNGLYSYQTFLMHMVPQLYTSISNSTEGKCTVTPDSNKHY